MGKKMKKTEGEWKKNEGKKSEENGGGKRRKKKKVKSI